MSHASIKEEGGQGRLNPLERRVGAGNAWAQRLSRVSLLSSPFTQRVTGTFILRGFNLALIFATSLLLARTLGATKYGAYALAISWAGLLAMPAMLGLQDLLVRLIAVYNAAGKWGEARGLLRRSDQIALTASTLVGAAAALVVMLFVEGAPGVKLALLAGFAVVPVMTMTRLREAALRGLNHTVQCQLPERLIQPIVFVALFLGLFLFARSGVEAYHVVSLYALAVVLALSVAVVRTRRILPPAMKTAVPTYHVGEWARGSLPLLVLAGGYAINHNTDIVMLGAFRGPDEAGIYFAAARLTTLIPFVLEAAAWTLGPLVASHYAAERMDDLRALARRGARLGLLFAIPISAAYLVFGDTLLGLFGEEFKQGLTVLIILTVMHLAMAASGLALLLSMTGHGKVAAFAMIVGVLTNVVLNALFIPPWGMEGAAIATSISLVIWKSLVLIFTRKRLGFFPVAFSWPSR